jgi:hypothetical protein
MLTAATYAEKQAANAAALAPYRGEASDEAFARAVGRLTSWGNVSDALSSYDGDSAPRDDREGLIRFQAKCVLLGYSAAQRAAHRAPQALAAE